MRRIAGLLALVVTAVLIPGTVRAEGRTIGPNVRTAGSVVVFNGDLNVYGTVRGDATAIRGNVIVHRGGRVQGDARSVGGRVILNGGSVGGAIRNHDARPHRAQLQTLAVAGRRNAGRSIGMAVGWLLIVALVGFGLMAFGADKLEIVIRTMQGGIGKSLGSGLLGQLAIVPAAIALVVLLAATLIGILLVPLGLVAFMFMVAGIAMFGFIAVATMTGAALSSGKQRDETPHGAMLRAFFTGTALYLGMWLLTAALSGVPLLGAMLQSFASAVTFIAVTTGFGAVLLSYWRGDFKRGQSTA